MMIILKSKNTSDATSDYGARQYSAEFCQWMQVDPMAEKYYSTTPYGFCNGNALRFVDMDGLYWRPTYSVNGLGDHTINGFEWVDDNLAFDANGNLLPDLYEAVVWVQGSYDETLDSNGKLIGKDAKPAQITIYGINGANDIKTYNGLSVTSNPMKYSMIENGDYKAFYQDMANSPYGSKGYSLSYRIANLDGSLNLPTAGGEINKQHPAQGAFLTETFFHRTNNNGWAGIKDDKAVSQGCIVIDASPYGQGWRTVEKQLGKSSNIFFRINR